MLSIQDNNIIVVGPLQLSEAVSGGATTNRSPLSSWKRVQGLSSAEREYLVRILLDVSSPRELTCLCQLSISGLGNGLDIRDSSGPRFSGLPVVDSVTLSSAVFINTTPGTEEVLSGSSARDIAYYKSGWAGQTMLAAERKLQSERLDAAVAAGDIDAEAAAKARAIMGFA